MKKYLIKDTLISTEKNTNFPNKTLTYYVGRTTIIENEKDICRIAECDGYTTKASATRGLKKQEALAEWETNRGFWKHTSVEIIEVEIAE